MATFHETFAGLAPTELDNYRTTRYRAEDQAVELSAFAPADREVVVSMYEMLRELDTLVSPDVEVEVEDAGPLVAFTERWKLSDLLPRIRRLGTARPDADLHLAEAIHDIRGGAFAALFVQLSRASRVPFRKQMVRSLFLSTRDHMKMMRNLAKDLDPVARARDLEMRAHSLADLARAMGGFTAQVGDAPVTVEVDCPADATIAESCVECGAIDRAAYNLMNNAVRHAAHPSFSAGLMTVGSNLRVAVANAITSEQGALLRERLAVDPASLFGTFTTTGSGFGLRIVAELVGRAYGVVSTDELTRSGYVGAKIVDDSFFSWFHWPLANA